MKNVYNSVNKSEHTFAHILSILQIQFIHELNRFEHHASNYIWIFFSTVNPTVLCNTQMAESMDMEQPLLQRTSYKLHTDFRLQGGSEPLISTPIGSRVNCTHISSSQRMVGNLFTFFLTVVRCFQMGIQGFFKRKKMFKIFKQKRKGKATVIQGEHFFLWDLGSKTHPIQHFQLPPQKCGWHVTANLSASPKCIIKIFHYLQHRHRCLTSDVRKYTGHDMKKTARFSSTHQVCSTWGYCKNVCHLIQHT